MHTFQKDQQIGPRSYVAVSKAIVLGRTAKTVRILLNDGKTVTKRIQRDQDREYIYPRGRYSMAETFVAPDPDQDQAIARDFSWCHCNFQAKIERISKVAEIPPLDMYRKWLIYCDHMSGQSALLDKFIQTLGEHGPYVEFRAALEGESEPEDVPPLPVIYPTEPVATDRARVLLRAAWDLLKRNASFHYVEEAACTEVFYDDANCDGGCLMDDIAIELDLDDNARPIPLKKEEGEDDES